LQNWNFHFYRIEILLTIGVPVSKRYSMSEIKLDQSIKEMQEELKKARERLMSLLDEERKIEDNGAQNTQQGIKLINTTIPEQGVFQLPKVPSGYGWDFERGPGRSPGKI
jgi:hypothetical protein